jgi:N6-adenosine-specific RNA methylase IME4
MWYIGDWLLAGESRGYVERGKHEEACELFGITYQTAVDAAVTCRAIDQSLRRPRLSYTHHRQVANRDDAAELLDWAEAIDATTRELRHEKVRRDRTASIDVDLPKGTFNVIYADPPWKYGDERGTVAAGGAVAAYRLMPTDELCSMELPAIAENAVLFMWVTAPMVPDAQRVIDAWGFDYKTNIVWDKQNPMYGNYSHVQHETLYIATRGSCVPADQSDLPRSVQSIKKTDHSRKPVEFYEIIETLYPKAKRVELFARNKRKGWKSWGNEVAT